MRKMALALAFFSVATAPAHAASALPPIVATRIAEDMKTCNSGATTKPGFVTQKDINGDGRPDYILDYQHLICDGMPSFCGSGGCSTVVFASRGGGYIKVLDDLGGKLSFTTIGGRPAMVFPQRSGRSTLIWNGSTFTPARR